MKAIQNLPNPVGIYTHGDDQGSWLRGQLLDSGIPIPDQVAIVGTGDMHRIAAMSDYRF